MSCSSVKHGEWCQLPPTFVFLNRGWTISGKNATID